METKTALSNPILWWELRRIPYNLLLLLLGSATLVVMVTVGSLFEHSDKVTIEPLGILFGVIVYGLAANVCYTLGWITELIWLGTGSVETRMASRMKAHRVGVIFSAGLTLLPGILFLFIGVLYLVFHTRT